MEERLIAKKIILKKSKTINLAKFTTARSYRCLVGVNLVADNVIVFFRDAKSRFLQNDFNKLENLANLVAEDEDRIIKKRYLFLSSQICSKALNLAKERGWQCYL
ncbi:MAG: hypothetical protein GXZ15_04810 [Campylobacter sp.]|nr:hypothetical protein [Campylobacter sp.]